MEDRKEKRKNACREGRSAGLLLLGLGAWTGALAQADGEGLAAKYRQDAGIARDPAVVFAEDFEKKSVAEVSARWSQTHNGAGMSLEKDVPAGSAAGSQSLRITSVGGSTDGGHLFLRVNPPAADRLYLRFYLKYAAGGSYHHSGGGLGGYNPPTSYSQGQAGTRPSGSDLISVRAERVTGHASRFDYYAYWMEMRGNPANASFWGNHFINDPKVAVGGGAWTCIEYMVKLNNPVTARNGELAMWIDGRKVSHLGPGFPKGRWVWDKFTPDSSGQPFEGFRWRKDAALALNWIRLSHFTSTDPAGYRGMVGYDQVVLATRYIGPLGEGQSTALARPSARSGPALARGPGNSIRISLAEGERADPASVRITDLGGRRMPGWTVRASGLGLIAEGPAAGAGRHGMVTVTLQSGGRRVSKRMMLTGP